MASVDHSADTRPRHACLSEAGGDVDSSLVDCAYGRIQVAVGQIFCDRADGAWEAGDTPLWEVVGFVRHLDGRDRHNAIRCRLVSGNGDLRSPLPDANGEAEWPEDAVALRIVADQARQRQADRLAGCDPGLAMPSPVLPRVMLDGPSLTLGFIFGILIVAGAWLCIAEAPSATGVFGGILSSAAAGGFLLADRKARRDRLLVAAAIRGEWRH